MYLAVQRVHSPKNELEGFNTFLYSHPGVSWDGSPELLLRGPQEAVLVAQTIGLAPPGNRVRSYLDITAPDETAWPEIERSLAAYLRATARREFPFSGYAGRCSFSLSMDSELAKAWRSELANLLRFAQAVRLATPL
ncbi:MAG: hypothetical protein RJA70_2423 [Pseudomonadota bacterium]